MTASPSEQRRLNAVVAAVQRSDLAPVPICGDLAIQARSGTLLEGLASMCGEHPLTGVMCGHCHRAHDERADFEHDTISIHRQICMNCFEPIDPPPPEGGLEEMQLLDLALVFEFTGELFHVDKLVVLVNVADRLCARCRAGKIDQGRLPEG